MKKNMKNRGSELLLLSLAIAELCLIGTTLNWDGTKEIIKSHPDDQSKWCNGIEFNQTIARANCKETQIINKMCYGECLSYYRPGREHDEVACFACRPSQQETKAVFLDCPEDPRRKVQVTFIQIVKECRCMLIDLKGSDISNGPL